MKHTLLLIWITFFLGLFYVCNLSAPPVQYQEPFAEQETRAMQKEIPERCPNLLIKIGNKYHLKNTRQVEVPGVNPIVFSSLEEYKTFLNWQQSQDINCPVLFLTTSYNPQGELVYKVNETLAESAPGRVDHYVSTQPDDLLPSRVNFNQSDFPSFDPHNQNVGKDTPLDHIYTDSPMVNAMSTDWAGGTVSEYRKSQGFKEVATPVP